MVTGPICVPLFQEKLFFWTDIYFPNSISGIDWVAKAAKKSSRPSVASLSIGNPTYEPADDAVTNLVSSGVTTVVAAGNDGADAYRYSPARVPSVITVAASTIADDRANYSNWGGAIDIWAPGTQELMSRSLKPSHPFAQDPILSLPGTMAKPTPLTELPWLPPMSLVMLPISLPLTLH